MPERTPPDRGSGRPEDEDHDAVDRAFAALVAGYHLTSDRPDPLPPRVGPVTVDPPGPSPDAAVVPMPRWPPPEPDPDDDPGPADRFVPPPPAPLPKPAWPTLAGWLGMGYAVLAMLAVVIGVPLPRWVAWAAVAGFVGGFALLVARLPRSRPPDSDEGAVV